MRIEHCGWGGALQEFLSIEEAKWSTALVEHHLECMNMGAEKSQQTAWHNCFLALRENLATVVNEHPEAKSWTIIFEYELPRERGRRPDVVILTHREIFVLEFKDFVAPTQAHIDQAAAYGRDLQNYHAACHDNPVITFLVVTLVKGKKQRVQDVYVVSPDSLPEAISESIGQTDLPIIDAAKWITADYDPLPTLVEAARNIFKHQPLPQIHRAQSAGIPQTIEELLRIAKEAQAKGEYHLALVTGVPGAGKTLVGLQFVYDNFFGDVNTKRPSVFLSGNKPLVTVLRYVLKSSIFVQDVHGFLKEYGGNQTRNPEESIIIFDEAQRAWDQKRAQRQRPNAVSEPEDFLRIGQRKPWAMMVGLIGEGQEIYLGEEAGLEQWNDAVAKSKVNWIVHCAEGLKPTFSAAAQVQVNEFLNLTNSLRSHLAEHVQLWIHQLLDGEISDAAKTMEKIHGEHFNIYLTRNLGEAQKYVRERYAEEVEKRYGIIASSRAYNLKRYGVLNDYNSTQGLQIGPWFNDPPTSRYSCCRLEQVATEFQCQGLELDYPIMCWGDDLKWQGRWVSPPPGPNNEARDPHRLRVNSYRVLLSRGRDGMIIFVPDEPAMNSTYQVLQSAGVPLLA